MVSSYNYIATHCGWFQNAMSTHRGQAPLEHLHVNHFHFKYHLQRPPAMCQPLSYLHPISVKQALLCPIAGEKNKLREVRPRLPPHIARIPVSPSDKARRELEAPHRCCTENLLSASIDPSPAPSSSPSCPSPAKPSRAAQASVQYTSWGCSQGVVLFPSQTLTRQKCNSGFLAWATVCFS